VGKTAGLRKSINHRANLEVQKDYNGKDEGKKRLNSCYCFWEAMGEK